MLQATVRDCGCKPPQRRGYCPNPDDVRGGRQGENFHEDPATRHNHHNVADACLGS